MSPEWGRLSKWGSMRARGGGGRGRQNQPAKKSERDLEGNGEQEAFEEREGRVRTACREGCFCCAVKDTLEGEQSIREPNWENWSQSSCNPMAVRMGLTCFQPCPPPAVEETVFH